MKTLTKEAIDFIFDEKGIVLCPEIDSENYLYLKTLSELWNSFCTSDKEQILDGDWDLYDIADLVFDRDNTGEFLEYVFEFLKWEDHKGVVARIFKLETNQKKEVIK